MIADFMTVADTVLSFVLPPLISFVIPVLSGILARVLVAHAWGAFDLAVLISTAACGILLYRLGFFSEGISPLWLVWCVPMAIMAIVGVKATAAFYSGFDAATSAGKEDTESREDKRL